LKLLLGIISNLELERRRLWSRFLLLLLFGAPLCFRAFCAIFSLGLSWLILALLRPVTGVLWQRMLPGATDLALDGWFNRRGLG
jgi:hypothetical protein